MRVNATVQRQAAAAAAATATSDGSAKRGALLHAALVERAAGVAQALYEFAFAPTLGCDKASG